MTSKNGKIAIVGAVVVVVIIAILILGFVPGVWPGGGASLVASCIATPGYACQSASLSGGNFTAVVGQASGTAWTQANIFVVISGSPNPTSVPPLPCEEGFARGITSGQTVNLTLSSYSNSNTCAGFPKTSGATFDGTVWAGYRTSTNSTEQVVEIGTVTLREA
ncbi:MAG TPA: hypothetical protein VL944_00305 [Candidatus Acidoferrum sp.]|nr:hypothetical protein [Candidatus Acidoferrum sp.]